MCQTGRRTRLARERAFTDPRTGPARTLCKMRFSRALLSVLVAGLAVGCASQPGGQAATPAAGAQAQARASGAVATATSTSGEMAEGAPREELPWATLSPETFARAKAEHKYIVLDGSAEWCHWCHVMEATTYHDAEVRKILDKHFIAVKVDVDSRPDVEERYGDYGWPATVMFAPDATEIGKYRGYINPEKFKGILEDIVASGLAQKKGDEKPKPVVKAPKTALSEEHLAWIQREIDVQLEDYYDEDQGSWGRQQKAPLGWNNAWTLEKAKKGDEQAKAKALFTLDKQSALLDPVWGGIYQYSAARDWDSPHFEKLMTFQAPALDNYATAYRLTNDAKYLARAKAMQGFLDRFMKSPEGGFYTTQDADLNAHDRGKAFMDGHDYYKLDEKGRLAHGIPRIDTHEYGKENGLAISAYCTMFEVTKDPAVLATAEKATRRILAT
ncbi:MAG: Thymidylate kinase, partial [Myxococcaceae bacterium]|nr:Thymidylate kinase [Myxococcaceae bacterium]